MSFDSNPLVSIICPAYNHEAFIKQALDGFLMQKTNFLFEILVHDDASTDNTKSILLEYEMKYPDRFNNIYQKENQFSKNIILPTINLLASSKGKYIACCEGDDYWTDPFKLQKQVDFLESNNEFTICWTKYLIQKNDTLSKPDWENILSFKDHHIINFDNFSKPYNTYTLTTVFRRKCIINELYKNYKYFKDNSLYAICMSKGKGAILDFYSGVYRMHTGGIYSATNEYFQDKANYFNFLEILVRFTKSRTDHFYFLENYFKRKYLLELENQKSWFILKINYVVKKWRLVLSNPSFGLIKRLIKNK